jgi:hypothetical protein
MSGESEFGTCEVCKQESNLQRTYYHYDLQCECHSPCHFEIVRHCSVCHPFEPKETKVVLRTRDLKLADNEQR